MVWILGRVVVRSLPTRRDRETLQNGDAMPGSGYRLTITKPNGTKTSLDFQSVDAATRWADDIMEGMDASVVRETMFEIGPIESEDEWEPEVGDRVEVPNPDGEGKSLMEQQLEATIVSVGSWGFEVEFDNGENPGISWVVDDGVTLVRKGATNV